MTFPASVPPPYFSRNCWILLIRWLALQQSMDHERWRI